MGCEDSLFQWIFVEPGNRLYFGSDDYADSRCTLVLLSSLDVLCCST
jgi:hypothetical protein